MKKRGQVSTFIIIAIIILIVISVFFLFYSPVKNKPDFSDNSLKSAILDCLGKTARQGIYEIGSTGGYYNLTGIPSEEGISYYEIYNQLKIPDKEIIEKELSNYVNDNLGKCIENQKVFNITFNEKIKSGCKINAESVNVKLNSRISYKKGEETVNFDNFDAQISTRFYVLYNIAQNFSKIYQENQGIDFTFISQISEDYGVVFYMQDYGNYIQIQLQDKKGVEGNYFEYNFLLGK